MLYVFKNIIARALASHYYEVFVLYGRLNIDLIIFHVQVSWSITQHLSYTYIKKKDNKPIKHKNRLSIPRRTAGRQISGCGSVVVVPSISL
jgi:hypothetical protein